MKDWEYSPAPDLEKSLKEKLQGFPRQPDMTMYFLRSMAALALRAWLRVYHRLEIDGRRHLPSAGSFVMIANHTSHLDALCLLSSLPLKSLHRAFPAAAADYFFSSLPRSLFSATVVNALPFERQIKGGQSLEVCSELLANPGNVLIIFPEGTRSLDGELGRFRSGVGRLVAGREIPVLPCHLSGATRAWPKGASFPRPRGLRLAIGAPLLYASREAGPESVREIVHELREAVVRLAAKE